MKTINDTRLVQRLQQPRTGRMAMAAEAFSFGGGYKNGGLSDEAMAILRDVFSFDYMGAAEYEFGAVPQALNKIARSKDLMAGAVDITVDGVEHKIYVICDFEILPHVITFLIEDALGNARLKMSSGFASALNPKNDWDTKTVGWLELDNGFFYFLDKEMWNKTKTLFGAVEV